jgi:hypothetical protein
VTLVAVLALVAQALWGDHIFVRSVAFALALPRQTSGLPWLNIKA